jgi:hypothetical protein
VQVQAAIDKDRRAKDVYSTPPALSWITHTPRLVGSDGEEAVRMPTGPISIGVPSCPIQHAVLP